MYAATAEPRIPELIRRISESAVWRRVPAPSRRAVAPAIVVHGAPAIAGAPEAHGFVGRAGLALDAASRSARVRDCACGRRRGCPWAWKGLGGVERGICAWRARRRGRGLQAVLLDAGDPGSAAASSARRRQAAFGVPGEPVERAQAVGSSASCFSRAADLARELGGLGVQLGPREPCWGRSRRRDRPGPWRPRRSGGRSRPGGLLDRLEVGLGLLGRWDRGGLGVALALHQGGGLLGAVTTGGQRRAGDLDDVVRSPGGSRTWAWPPG